MTFARPLFRRNIADVSSAAYKRTYNALAGPSLRPLDTFQRRHLGPDDSGIAHQLKTLGHSDLELFVSLVVPENVLVKRPLKVAPEQGFSESELIEKLRDLASQNNTAIKSFIGKGYYNTILPPVVQRNLFESPEWYTSYTPYQPEILQGRLESLLNYQTMVTDLTGLDVANASLLDEGTAAAEAMLVAFNHGKQKKKTFYVDVDTHPQTVGVIKARASTLGIKLVPVDLGSQDVASLIAADPDVCGVLALYPGSSGEIRTGLQAISDAIHSQKGLFCVATDLLALTVLAPPSSFGADIALGLAQRFGVPMGYGGPHAAFFASIKALERKIPGRIVGVSKDRLGRPAYRLALQTREQHIRRERATSNICTAQALLANMAANYAVYHGPQGLKRIAERVRLYTGLVASAIDASAHSRVNSTFFDTLTVKLAGISADEFMTKAVSEYNINLFKVDDLTISLSLDESVTEKDLSLLVSLFGGKSDPSTSYSLPEAVQRSTPYLTHEVFNRYHLETAMMRYLHQLQSKDLSLADLMITLGSCTMKLNSAVEMIPVSFPGFLLLHPFVPKDQAKGYSQLVAELEADLADITGFSATTLMPNSGAQGEYTGLTVIKAYLASKGQADRNVCLIPVSAHGTNPASAAMAGLKVVAVKCKEDGSLDLADLEAKAKKHKDKLAAAMITYPSTYGLFEPGIRKAIDIVHEFGGQVYLDGANMNAQVGLTSPGDLGADVCHLNLHKTFAIPHGGGGPGVGPICVAAHLKKFLPLHPVVSTNSNDGAIQPVSSAPYGSALILPISYAYIKLMGATGLPFASAIAMLNANYMMHKLREHYKIMFVGDNGACGHEFILDLRKLKSEAGVEAIDVAKRLQDYGFHAPTMSFPVANTLMIEPTESENVEELDRFVEALILIRQEIEWKKQGDPRGNVLVNAPHSLDDLLTSPDWDSRGYTREMAGYPLKHLKQAKSWPTVCRVDDKYGDTHLLCTCPSVEEMALE